MVLPLVNNHNEDEFDYELHVHTGASRHSDTKSKVYFRLHGTEGETGVRKLDDGVRVVSSDIFSAIFSLKLELR